MTIVPSLTSPPPAPNRNMLRDAFVAAANAFVAWMVTFVSEMLLTISAMNSVASEVNAAASTATLAATSAGASATAAAAASTYFATSNSSVALGTGSKAFTLVQTSRAFLAGDEVVAVRRSDASIRLRGVVASYTSNVLTITVSSGGSSGSGGPYSDWMVIHSAFESSTPADASDIWAATSSVEAVTPASLAASAARQTLVDASTITLNLGGGYNAKVTPSVAGRTIGAPSGTPFDGQPISLEIIQPVGGLVTVNWNAVWDFGAAGLPVLQTGANKRDKVYAEWNAATSKWDATFRKGA